jgi:hypothetical protein
MLRPIKPIPLIGIALKPIPSKAPIFGWADPKALLVENEYQRELSKASITLIRKIAAEFDWLHIKPVVCARGSNDKLCVIDGQHTAIAAASRGVPKVPVIIVEAKEIKKRAGAFVSHNTNRLNITPMQLFYSRKASGDAQAIATDRVARSVGVNICHSYPPNGLWRVGDTVAISAIERLVVRLREENAARVLKTLVAAKRGPVVCHEILAVEAVLYDSSLGWKHSAFDLVTVIRSKSIDAWRRPVLSRTEAGKLVRLWQGVARAWVRAGDRDA